MRLYLLIKEILSLRAWRFFARRGNPDFNFSWIASSYKALLAMTSKLALATMVLMITGCATTNKNKINPQDPYERFNRHAFGFNMAVDRALFRPIAKVYDAVLPWPVKKGVTHVFNNIGDVTSAANEILQFKLSHAVSDLARVVINTTIGIGGLFDVATSLGIERDVEDFGLTLAHWGARNTPYLVLPFFGSSTVRDAIGLPVNLLLNPLTYINQPTITYSAAGVYTVQRRAMFLIGDKVIEEAFDPYVFVRDAYLQRREFLIEERNENHVEHYTNEDGVNCRKTQTLKESHVMH